LDGDVKQISALVRVRFRANNDRGGKEINDFLYSINAGGSIARFGQGADDWPKHLQVP
jgi:hypothetical protein